MATSTTNYGLTKPADGEYNWGASLNHNADTIDTNLDRVDTQVQAQHNTDGTHSAVTATSVTTSGNVSAGTDVVTPSITLGGVQRNTWPASGSATQALDDILVNGSVTTKKATFGELDFGAITATLPNLTFIDTCLWLSRDDTDGGAWRKKGKGKSWYSETRTTGKYLGSVAVTTTSTNTAALLSMINAGTAALGDYLYASGTGTAFVQITGITGTAPSATAYTLTLTYRAGSADFPADALVTAEAARVIIWDITGSQPTMWMVFIKGASFHIGNPTAITSIASSNQTLIIGESDNGTISINFVTDKSVSYLATGFNSTYLNSIATRNSAGSKTIISGNIVNNAVNDVAITVLEDAPLDEYGMPVPTIAVATAGGVSVIKQDGNVWDITGFSPVLSISIHNDRLVASTNLASVAYAIVGPIGITSDIAFGSWQDGQYTTTTGSALKLPFNGLGNVSVFNKNLYMSGTGGFVSISHNNSAATKGLLAAITSTYNSGFLIGDIRRCFLANSQTADRSVKAGTLTVVGTPTETVNAGGRNVYSGFSAANYFQEASHADWNALGTGDFSIIMSGVKWGTAGQQRSMLNTGDGATDGAIHLLVSTANTLQWYVRSGGATIAVFSSATTFTDTAEHVVEFKRISGIAYILVDGVTVASSAFAYSISCAAGALYIGVNAVQTTFWTGGQVACVRISATAPTAEQSKFIAAQENALNGGATCLLSNSSSVSRLAYDKHTDILRVGNGTNVDDFVGLKRVASVAHGVTTLTALDSANGFNVVGGTGGSYSAPALSVRSEMMKAQTDLAKNAKPVVLDFNVVTNAKFSTGTGWTLGTGWSIAGGVATKVAGTGSYLTANLPTLPAGKTYRTVYTISGYAAGSAQMNVGGVGGTLYSANGTYSELITTNGGVTTAVFGNATFAGSIDNVFIRESTDKLPQGFKPTKVWAGGLLQEEGTDYYVTFDGFLYGIVWYIEPATNVQVEGIYNV